MFFYTVYVKINIYIYLLSRKTYMIDFIIQLLREHQIDLAAPINLKDCRITRPYKLENVGFDGNSPLSAVIFAVPYLVPGIERNISAYAVGRDYHGYFKELFDTIVPALKERFPENKFAGFSDDSPIDERLAAAKAGIGILGENGLLITDKYSSYVFLGEMITDLPLESSPIEPAHCSGCGKCIAACPKNEIGKCLSELTQKKGELSAEEISFIKKYGSAWGCDICQEVCPHTIKAKKEQTIYTNIDYFKNNCIPTLSAELLCQMDDEEFQKRAYSWRKRATVLRNLEIIAHKDKSNE